MDLDLTTHVAAQSAQLVPGTSEFNYLFLLGLLVITLIITLGVKKRVNNRT